MDNLWFALWFFLPAGIANASPVFANKIPGLNRWNTPMDLGRSFRGQRIFGTNKTLRGLVFSVFIAGLVNIVIYLIHPDYFSRLGLAPDNPLLQAFFIGTALGLGALLGDAIESFFKRQSGRKPGSSWFPFDQIDYILGALLMVSVFVALSPSQGMWILAVWFLLHLISAYIGYLLKLKDTPI